MSALLIGMGGAIAGYGATAIGSKGEPIPLVAEASLASVGLHVDAGSHSVAGSTITVRGVATRGSTVTVDGHRATMRGVHWSETLDLRLGRNRVVVKAVLKGRKSARKTVLLIRERSSAEIEGQVPTPETQATPQQVAPPPPATTTNPVPSEACTNGTYVNSAGNTVCSPEESPTDPPGATAQCVDGTYSFSQSRSGTCSHHGGVARWL
jgi:hypothetical protein